MQVVDSCCDESKNQTNMENNMVPFFKGEKEKAVDLRLDCKETLTTSSWGSKVN